MFLKRAKNLPKLETYSNARRVRRFPPKVRRARQRRLKKGLQRYWSAAAVAERIVKAKEERLAFVEARKAARRERKATRPIRPMFV